MTFAPARRRDCTSRSLQQSPSRGHASVSIANLDPDQTLERTKNGNAPRFSLSYICIISFSPIIWNGRSRRPGIFPATWMGATAKNRKAIYRRGGGLTLKPVVPAMEYPGSKKLGSTYDRSSSSNSAASSSESRAPHDGPRHLNSNVFPRVVSSWSGGRLQRKTIRFSEDGRGRGGGKVRG